MTFFDHILEHSGKGYGLKESIAYARLTAARQAQPLAELRRKADKAVRRQHIGTQEELDVEETDPCNTHN